MLYVNWVNARVKHVKDDFSYEMNFSATQTQGLRLNQIFSHIVQHYNT